MADEQTTQNAEAAPEAPEPQVRDMSLLAAEKFGHQYHGRREPVEPSTETEETEDNAEERAEEGTDAEEPDAGDREAPEGEEVEGESEEEVIQSWNELVEAQGWDPEWASGLKVPVKIDGQDGEATFEDLVRSYQTQTAAEKRLEEAKAKSKQINEQVQQKADELNGSFQQVGALITRAESMLDSEMNGVDWQKLRVDDPSEYAAKKQEIAERREEIEKMKREAYQSYQQASQQQEQEAQQKRMEQLQVEQEALLQKLPDWKDPEKAQAEKTKLVGYLTTQGFDENDVMGASDHRLIVLARKAMLYDESQGKSDAARKKVQKVPKVLKPGAPKSNEQQQKESEDKVRQRLRSKGDLDSALTLMKSRRK